MPRTDSMSVTLRLNEAVSEFVAQRVGAGSYATGGEYIRDLIRRDYERARREHLEKLEAQRVKYAG